MPRLLPFFPFLQAPVSKHILLAEDDAFLAETIQLALVEHGMTVRLAENGEEGIARIEELQPDLLLLDLLMPKKDGYAVLNHIKAQGYAFPVIIMSNLSDELDREKCLSLGAKDFFIKSDMDEEELWPTIQKYL
jgi:two-component system, OmpR family, response regulator VicR